MLDTETHIVGSVGYLLTDGRIFSVFGYAKDIHETETENFPVGYYYFFFFRRVRTPMQGNVFLECAVSRHIGTLAYDRIINTCIAKRTNNVHIT